MATHRLLGKTITLVLILAAAATAAWFLWGRKTQKPPEVTTVAVTKGDLVQAITATGILQATTSVDISSQISGQIKDVLVDYNQPVKKGDVLARIDAATYESRLRQAEATLASTTASNTLTRLNTERTRALRAQNLVSQQELDAAEAQLAQSNAQLLQAKASVEDARVNLDRCTLYAPIDGVVLDRLAEVGKMVAASLNAPTLFTLVDDLAKMQISADVAEADIGNIALNQEVNFTVDAYPGRTFTGRISQIRNLPKTSQSVVVYATIINVENPQLRLKPGMTANVSIIVAKRTAALKIPNAALRARIPKEYLPPTPPAPAATASTTAAATTEKPALKTLTDDERRKAIREIMQEIGYQRGSGPMSPAMRQQAEALAQARGIEIDFSRFGGGSNRERTEATVTTRTLYRLVSPLPDLKIEPITVKLGITDGTATEVIEGLAENDTLVASLYTANDSAAATQNRNPFGGQTGGPGGPAGRRF